MKNDDFTIEHDDFSSIFDPVSVSYQSKERLAKLHEEFCANGYVKLEKFLKESVFQMISREVNNLHADRSRKDFIMPSYETPRHMSVMSGSEVSKKSDAIALLYASPLLKMAIEELVGMKIHSVHHAEEFLVANFLDGIDDTHGWHLDDPRYALIIIIEAPGPGLGGQLEFVPAWKKFLKNASLEGTDQLNGAVSMARQHGLVQVVSFVASDCYLLDAGENLHRVCPLTGHARRKSINLAFDDRQFRIYGDTAMRLYG